MEMTRRAFLAAAALALGAAPASPRRMGIVIHSYSRRRFRDPLEFLEHAATLGAGSIQIGLGQRDGAFRRRFRERAEQLGIATEGMVRLPEGQADLDRFRADLVAARDAGMTVLRTAILSGRRYETFRTAAAYQEFARRAWESLALARPVVEQEKVRLAIENHKDWRIDELLGLLKRLNSPSIGVCVDTGNSIALLEDPYTVVEGYAPFAVTTHIKDMGVAEYPDGFLLSEVPLGTGFLDMPRICQTLTKAQPGIRLNLEMITRDPLKVPCLSRDYWQTFDNLPGRDLAATLALVRANPPREPLPTPARLSLPAALGREEENVKLCLRFAAEKLTS